MAAASWAIAVALAVVADGLRRPEQSSGSATFYPVKGR